MANTDSLGVCFKEEDLKHEKLERDHTQHQTNLITNCTNKEVVLHVKENLYEGNSCSWAICSLCNYTESRESHFFHFFRVIPGRSGRAANQLEKFSNQNLKEQSISKCKHSFKFLASRLFM